ncbi:MAG: hypothetical protein HY069_01855 [Chlamydiia bacterium]|nr:hypothetical protein [Chlamydiia bacterium]
MLDTTKPTTFWSSFQTYNLKWSMDVWKQTAPTALGKTMQKVALVVFPIFLVILYVEIFVKNLVVVTVVKTFTSIAHFIRPPKPEPEKLSQPPAPPSSLTPPVAGGAGVEGAPENPVSNKAPAAAPRALSAPPAGENSLALMPYGAAPTQKTPQPPPPPLLALTGPDTVQSLGQTN